MHEAAKRPVPTLSADLLLLHPPAFFEFRGRRDLYFPFLGTTGDVPITPLYEFFPLGFKKLQRHLGARGHEVKILNLSTLLLRYREADLDELFRALRVRLVGIDLHWLIHVQGSLAVAERLRAVRPDLPIVFGGISSTYYAQELVRHPSVDMVMRGYDTLEPMAALMRELAAGREPTAVPNLIWKGRGGEVVDNGLTYTPTAFGCGIDWSRLPDSGGGSLMSIREITTSHNAGCAFGCGYCGGSGEAFGRLYGTSRHLAMKPLEEMRFEVGSMVHDGEGYHLYSMGLDSLGSERAEALLRWTEAVKLKSINFEQYFLPSDEQLDRMLKLSKRTLVTLSPDCHDEKIARALGRGVYGNEELERFVERALERGVEKVDIWYFVGMPGQDERSAMETVAYCERLLERFKGGADPMICPLLPNLDPASSFFERPEEHGYRLFARTLADHRAASMRASPIFRMNYETRWLSREDIYRVGMQAIGRLMQAKARAGLFPAPRVAQFVARIDDALAFTRVVHEADALADPVARAREIEKLGGEILRRNEELLTGGVMDQTYPIRRQIGGRWCDELGWSARELDVAYGRVPAPGATSTA